MSTVVRSGGLKGRLRRPIGAFSGTHIHTYFISATQSTHIKLEGEYSLESTDPRESEIRAPPPLTIALKLSCYLFIIIVKNLTV